MQETWDWSLVWEDPTSRGATKHVNHSYWACALEPGSCDNWAFALQLLKPVHPRAHAQQQEKIPQWKPQPESSPHSPQLEKSLPSNEDPAQPIKK